jgi:hypothetical protein
MAWDTVKLCRGLDQVMRVELGASPSLVGWVPRPRSSAPTLPIFEGLQALRVYTTRELKWLECKGMDIQNSFLLEIEHDRACESSLASALSPFCPPFRVVSGPVSVSPLGL